MNDTELMSVKWEGLEESIVEWRQSILLPWKVGLSLLSGCTETWICSALKCVRVNPGANECSHSPLQGGQLCVPAAELTAPWHTAKRLNCNRFEPCSQAFENYHLPLATGWRFLWQLRALSRVCINESGFGCTEKRGLHLPAACLQLFAHFSRIWGGALCCCCVCSFVIVHILCISCEHG